MVVADRDPAGRRFGNVGQPESAAALVGAVVLSCRTVGRLLVVLALGAVVGATSARHVPDEDLLRGTT